MPVPARCLKPCWSTTPTPLTHSNRACHRGSGTRVQSSLLSNKHAEPPIHLRHLSPHAAVPRPTPPTKRRFLVKLLGRGAARERQEGPNGQRAKHSASPSAAPLQRCGGGRGGGDKTRQVIRQDKQGITTASPVEDATALPALDQPMPQACITSSSIAVRMLNARLRCSIPDRW